MPKVICFISLCLSSIYLSACGQTGALQLPSDPDYDHRAKYMLSPQPKPSAPSATSQIRQQLPVASSETTTP
jgi:hypothetical protein